MTNETKLLIGITIATILIVIIAAVSFGGKSDTTNVPIKNQQLLIRSNSHQEKITGAKVTIVEFGDFQCPACGAAYPVVEQLLANYKGKVNFVFRNYPLPIHQNARIAAEAAEASGEQGKFFPMYKELYLNQKDWSESTKPINYFLKYAKDLNLDINKFKNEVASKKFENKINQDVADGDALTITATPTFFINGVQQVGGLPYNEFQAKIDAALK